MRRARLAFAAALALVAPTLAYADVTYRDYNGDVYGSDGTRIHRFGGDTYIRDRNGRETRCHTFAGKMTCR